jgi:RNA polymerase sigma-70 factor (ECF subfamily)
MRELIERARNGDRDAFAQLAAGQIDRLNAVARLILRDADMADDAVQETMVRCWQQLPRLRDADRFGAWLNRILMRAVIDQTRRWRRIQVAIDNIGSGPATPDTSVDVANRDELERAFRQLSISHRTVVVLHHYGGLELTEVAAALGIPAGTARSRYHYAMSSLRAALESDARGAVAREARG